MKNHEAVDVVIVGAGAAGSQLAAKLARGGKRVVVLEAGPPWQLRDMFSSQIWARRLKWSAAPVNTTGTAPVPVTFNLGGGLGGSAIHHYANWYRLHPEDFKEQTLFGQNLDWPITYDDLRPFYDEVQTEIGISGDSQRKLPAHPPRPIPCRRLKPSVMPTSSPRVLRISEWGVSPPLTPSIRSSTKAVMPAFMTAGAMRAALLAHSLTRLSPTYPPLLPPVPSFAHGRT